MSAFATFVGEVVHGIVREITSAPEEEIRRRIEEVRDAVQPPDGVWLDVPDGAEFTGVIVVDRNRPVLMLCVRQDPASRRWSRPTAWPTDARLPYWDGGVEE